MLESIYTQHVSGGMGNITIEGIYLPHQYFDPLAKLWATVRKEVRKKFKVDVAGAFFYDDVQEVISCNFYLNYSIIEFKDISDEEYQEQFLLSWDKIADGFEAVINLFVEDDAFNEYVELTEKAASGTNSVAHGDFDRLFNIFLKDLGIRQMDP